MLLKSYINREVFRTSLAILIILILIFTSARFVDYIQLAVEGRISSQAVFFLLALQIPAVAGFLLPLSLFIGIILVFGRLYSESEMAAIRSIGVGEVDLMKNLLPMACILALIAGGLSFGLTPWASYQAKARLLKEEAEARFGAFAPGQFQQNKSRAEVAFVNSKNSSGEIESIFVVSGVDKQHAEMTIQVAKNGYLAKSQQDSTTGALLSSHMVLEDGASYKLNKLQNNWEVSQYASYYMRIQQPEPKTLELKTNAISTADLLQIFDAEAISALHWRLSAPLSTLIVCLLAVPLTRTQPRSGKFSRLLPAILIYMLYAVLLMNAREWVAAGKIPTVIGFWWIHILAIILALALHHSNLPKRRKTRSKKIKQGKSNV